MGHDTNEPFLLGISDQLSTVDSLPKLKLATQIGKCTHVSGFQKEQTLSRVSNIVMCI